LGVIIEASERKLRRSSRNSSVIKIKKVSCRAYGRIKSVLDIAPVLKKAAARPRMMIPLFSAPKSFFQQHDHEQI
jgi:hypothetical protein